MTSVNSPTNFKNFASKWSRASPAGSDEPVDDDALAQRSFECSRGSSAVLSFSATNRAKFRKDAYELTIRMPDGSEVVERFSDPTALHNRQVILEREWADGWTGPHGWNL